MIPRSILVGALLLTLAGPATAQLRTLVVPDGAAVVVPPRGGGAIRAPLAESRVLAPAPWEAPPPPARAGHDLNGPAGLAAMASVPLAIAAAVLATTLPGQGGGSSGPARTR